MPNTVDMLNSDVLYVFHFLGLGFAHDKFYYGGGMHITVNEWEADCRLGEAAGDLWYDTVEEWVEDVLCRIKLT